METLIKSGVIDAIPSSNANRVEEFESKFGLCFRRSFRRLLLCFDFDPFELGGIEFFGNSGLGEKDLLSVIFTDANMAPMLIEFGFLQIGCLDTGSYDPIGFNTRKGRGNEMEIVRIDHESILCNSRPRVDEVVSPSFPKWLEKHC